MKNSFKMQGFTFELKQEKESCTIKVEPIEMSVDTTPEETVKYLELLLTMLNGLEKLMK
jgi:hypothetical protein